MKLAFIGQNDLDGVKEDARFAAEHGFHGIEYNYWANFAELTADTVARMRDALQGHGVAVSALGLWGWNHIAPDADERAASLAHLERAIGFAQTLGASVLITGAGQIPGASVAENAAEFARVFPPYVDKVREAGMRLALYPLHGNSFVDRIEAYEAIWEQVPDVGIKLDPANFAHHGQEYLPILRDHGDRVYYVHIKEHLYMDGELVAQPAAGMGDIAWGKIMAFLYEHGYEGYLSLEPHGPLWSKPPLRDKMLLLSQRYLQQFIV
jgi:sugar phosphate isomerase/epimerase